MKALLMSADPSLRDLMRLALDGAERATGSPWTFLEAPDGIVAERMVWRERPDVVVADEYVSRAGAFALARELRGAMEPYRGIVVVLLDRPGDAWLARWSGADAWFTKPVDPFELSDTIVGLVADRREPAAVGGPETKERT